jgi:hypothetical protein
MSKYNWEDWEWPEDPQPGNFHERLHYLNQKIEALFDKEYNRSEESLRRRFERAADLAVDDVAAYCHLIRRGKMLILQYLDGSGPHDLAKWHDEKQFTILRQSGMKLKDHKLFFDKGNG